MRFCGRCGDGAADTHNYCETCGCGLVPFKYMTNCATTARTANGPVTSDPVNGVRRNAGWRPTSGRAMKLDRSGPVGWGDSATVAAGRALLPEPSIRTRP